jgi:hypothetical protein
MTLCKLRNKTATDPLPHLFSCASLPGRLLFSLFGKACPERVEGRSRGDLRGKRMEVLRGRHSRENGNPEKVVNFKSEFVSVRNWNIGF